MVFCVLCTCVQGKCILSISSMKQITGVCLMNYCGCPLWLQTQLAKPFLDASSHFCPRKACSSQFPATSVLQVPAGASLRAEDHTFPHLSLTGASRAPRCWHGQRSTKHPVKTAREVKGKPFTGFESHSIPRQTAGESSGENGIHHLWLDVGVAVEQ